MSIPFLETGDERVVPCASSQACKKICILMLAETICLQRDRPRCVRRRWTHPVKKRPHSPDQLPSLLKSGMYIRPLL